MANVGIERLFGFLCKRPASEKNIKEKERSIYVLQIGGETD